MVLIDIQIAGGLDVEIESAVPVNSSSMWSRNRMPVETAYRPFPSIVSFS